MKRSLFALALAAALPFSAQAAELATPNYTFVEAGYSKMPMNSEDYIEENADGFAVKGSMAFGQHFYGFANYSDYDFDRNIHVSPAELGAGFHMAIDDGTDFIGELSYIGLNSEFLDQDFDNDTYRAAIGVRSVVTKHLELEGKVTYTTVDDFESITGASLGALVHINDTWGVSASYHYKAFNFFDADFDTRQVGVRASF